MLSALLRFMSRSSFLYVFDRLTWRQSYLTQAFADLHVPLNISGAFYVNPSHQTFNIHQTGYGSGELQDDEGTIHRRVRPRGERDYLQCHVRELRQLDYVPELRFHNR